jgi:ABC-type transport system involved in multi-copper enzyme maturation permease subunit
VTPPYRSTLPAGRATFAQVVHAEWTKLRTVRGWTIGLAAMAVAMVLMSLLSAAGDGQPCRGGCPSIPLGPAGEPVTDTFYFVHQPLTGSGSITVRVTSLTGLIPSGADVVGRPLASVGRDGEPLADARPALQPWAKAGIIVAASTEQGSRYAAVMVTGGHGVRMQYDYTGDTAGAAGPVPPASPRWLRLTRAGDTLTGSESTGGADWREIGTVRLAGLPATVEAGLFVASPQEALVNRHLPFVTFSANRPTQATAVFDDVALRGAWPRAGWSGDDLRVPDAGYPAIGGGFRQAGGVFTVSGSGDIAPEVGGVDSAGRTIDDSLAGVFAGLIVAIVLGALFVTAEYRRGLIRTTLAASPRRGRVLAAKAAVLGSATFVAGLAGTVLSVVLAEQVLRADHDTIYPVGALTELQVVAGTAALLALAAVAGLAVGTMLRSGAGAIAAVVAAVVLPFYLVLPALPDDAGRWLMRITPAAGFTVQQVLPEYPQVNDLYTPASGYYPLPPWAGFAVLCAYAAAALGLAVLVLRRRDA